MDVPPLVVDRAAGEPLPVQVAAGLRDAAVRGTLAAGERLPSTRELARALCVSRTVTAAAYDQLLAEGWVEGRRGVGTFVVDAPAPDEPRSRPRPRRRPEQAARTGVDLRAGTPCTEVLERAAWRRAWRAAGDQPPDASPDPLGDRAFRAAVSSHLLRHRGLPADPDDVVATTGTSAAVAEVAALLPRGARVAVEDPGYRRVVGALRAAGLVPVPVPVDADGLVVDAVPAGVAAVYCTPAHQFPLGGRLPAGRRTRLVERARAEGFLVLEDDYDGELRYDVAPLPLLAALAPDVVVHLGTTSKTVSPTLGAGWAVCPAPLREALLDARTRTGTRPPRAGQRVLAAMASSGDLARHLRRLRRELSSRRELVRAAVLASGCEPVGDDAGAHLVVPLPSRAQEERVVAAAAGAGVVLGGLAGSCLESRSAGVVVGWAAPRRVELEPALGVLTAALADEA
ncbi:PLP-dependent aminotransferase family protein [uncultured Pseudokineococcus sp.]|uniref:MocR-like pyridoxine biosynthesis transcription factor PdxR n=1 Tax=uncultured Pseudokineococcus sp. TaxID=1642928 RepID=UPI00262324F3|nr:PLP-dependent aminotransferase family protein [uncultured Pseudokineococcus sp.]